MRGILVCVRERIPAYVSAYSYVRMQVWHSVRSLQEEGRIWFTSIIRQGRTQERGLQVRPAIRKAEVGGGGGGGGLYASDPLSTPVRYTYSMVKVTSLWGGDPSTPPPPTSPLCVEYGTLSRSGTSCYF